MPALLELYARVTSAPHHKKLRMVPYFPTRLQLPQNAKVLSASAHQPSDSSGDPSRKKALSGSHGASEVKGVRISLPVNLSHATNSENDSTKHDSSSTSSPAHTPKSHDTSEIHNSRASSASKLDAHVTTHSEAESEMDLSSSTYFAFFLFTTTGSLSPNAFIDA